MITEIKEALQDFRENPMEGLIFLLPVVILGISIVSGIVGYVSFIRQNGYKNQFAVIKSEGIMESFTKGTSTFGIKGPIGTTIIILLIIQVLVMLIAYFINSMVMRNDYRHSRCRCVNRGNLFNSMARI